jgi:hypothetical protein
MRALGFLLILLAPAFASFPEYEFGRVGDYRLVSDRQPFFRKDGVPELPLGAVVTVYDLADENFDVELAAPQSIHDGSARARWSQTLDREGEYRLRVRAPGGERGAVFSFSILGTSP